MSQRFCYEYIKNNASNEKPLTAKNISKNCPGLGERAIVKSLKLLRENKEVKYIYKNGTYFYTGIY
ncbi:MAG TPA: hypothetical protein PLI06_05540 [Methanofastidiosum sp.]|nr:hypothetical protein [Methanofastidiosum sp.]